ncbi:MAG: hypothetical protein EOP85_01505 [Verrucomicrobiaceae bacterium]|nr:MAG: hypothetical protein EOP85_01505 [Verrucomicrobiaceae bacterium]
MIDDEVMDQRQLIACGDVLNRLVSREGGSERLRTASNLRSVLAGAVHVHSSGGLGCLAALPSLIENWRILREEQSKKNGEFGHLFNPLSIIPISETTHSRIIGDLLDPGGSHGQGGRLLHKFLESIDVPNPRDGKWTVSVEKGNLDLCLRRVTPASVIIIENKSNMAVDQPNQLYRYWHEQIRGPFPDLDYASEGVKKSFQILYLCPGNERYPGNHSLRRPSYLDSQDLPDTLADVGVTIRACSFQSEIRGWLLRCIELIPPENHRLRICLQIYGELWS